MSFKKFLFILSTEAAGGRNLPTKEHILTNVDKNIEVEVVNTLYRGHTTNLAREFAQKNPGSVVVACGGDGTLREVAEGVFGTDSYFSAIPCGTGNDFYKTVAYGVSAEEMIKNIHKLTPSKIDLIKVNDKICLNVWNFGFDADVIVKAKELQAKHPKMQDLSYTFGAIKSVFGKLSTKMSYEIETVDHKWFTGSGNFLLGNVANGKYYGGGFNPAPRADVKDGILNVSLIDHTNSFQLLALLGKYKKGKHEHFKIVHTFDAVKGKLKSLEGEINGCYDGDIVRFSEAKFEVINNGLNFAEYEGKDG